jgi:hypothetical protein
VNGISKDVYQFDDFLAEVGTEQKGFAASIHEALLRDGYKCRIENKASGLFVSHSHPKTKRSITNLFFRKSGLFFRIYADNNDRYADLLNRMPADMEREIDKAPVCKRFIDPEDCNPKCIMGYDFSIRGKQYRKCRYVCFQFKVTAENMPFLSEFTKNEMENRNSI